MNENPQLGAGEPSAIIRNKGSGPDDQIRTEASSDQAKQALKEGLSEIGEQARQAAKTARDKVEELADQGKNQGAGQVQGFAPAVRGAADDLEVQSPQMARVARQAADGLDRAAASIRDRSIGEVADIFTDFARRQPTAFFGSAVLAGFVMTRFMKSRADRPRHMADRSPSKEPSRTESYASNADVRFPSPDNLPTSSSTIGEMPS